VYTFKYAGSSVGVCLKELIKHTWIGKDETRYVSGTGFDNKFLVRNFELMSTYLKGKYNKDIILDKQR